MTYFRLFTHGIITQNSKHRNIMYLYRSLSGNRSLGDREGEDKESNRGLQSKNWGPSDKFFYVLFSGTQSFLLGFSGSSDNITVSKKKSTSKKQPGIISEITISCLHKNMIPLLYQCGLSIHTCVSKNSVVSKDAILLPPLI